jgi:hypothetical protein
LKLSRIAEEKMNNSVGDISKSHDLDHHQLKDLDEDA